MHGLKTVSCYLLLFKIKICLFETYVLFPFRLPRTNLPRCTDQLTPTSGQVGPVYPCLEKRLYFLECFIERKSTNDHSECKMSN